jgi:hypothetical protein
MTMNESARLVRQLRQLGLSRQAIERAWPGWWSAEAESSTSARTELAFSLARRFGLDPRSLLEGSGGAEFRWADEARFKHRSNQSDAELSAITSFGKSVATALLAATPPGTSAIMGVSAAAIRAAILREGRPYPELGDLLALAWAVGVPVVQLRLYPLSRKRMAAMTVEVNSRSAVLIGKDANYPAPIAFYLAHELGHVAHGHAAGGRLLVDFEMAHPALVQDDEEERMADEFALEVLTGRPQPFVVAASGQRSSARELARVALSAGPDLGIEPGVLAQCYGFSTGDWPAASGALRRIYTEARAVWQPINALARRELDLRAIPADSAEFLEAVLGEPT